MMTTWDMWNHRNKALHKDETNRQEIPEDKVNQKISEAYAQGSDQLPTEAKVLMKDHSPDSSSSPDHTNTNG